MSDNGILVLHRYALQKIMDKKFKDLLTRFLDGTCSPEERERIHQWYEKISDNELQLDAEERRLIGDRMLANIQAGPKHRKMPERLRKIPASFLLRVAASVAVLTVLSLAFLGAKQFFASTTLWQVAGLATDVVYENTTGRPSLRALPDGSTVRLEPSGVLRYQKDFSTGNREVYLTGKAFFDIVKDPSRPFYVYTDQIATQVLGTSFFVDAPADATKVGVKVITGKVSVFQLDADREIEGDSSEVSDARANGVVLSPNQKVDYYIAEGHWVTGLVEDPVPIRSIDVETLSFVFSNTPIRNILDDINKRFGIEVLTENEKISGCTFTGDVSKMRLYDMLNVVSNSIGATYEVKGTRILMRGKGCDNNGTQKTDQ